jgi:hypothetical protein
MKHPDEMDEFELITYHTIVDDARAEEEHAAQEAAEAAARPAAEPVPADAEHTGDETCLICQGCESEFIDGSYTNCGCCDCEASEAQRRAENPEDDEEYGYAY